MFYCCIWTSYIINLILHISILPLIMCREDLSKGINSYWRWARDFVQLTIQTFIIIKNVALDTLGWNGVQICSALSGNYLNLKIACILIILYLCRHSNFFTRKIFIKIKCPSLDFLFFTSQYFIVIFNDINFQRKEWNLILVELSFKSLSLLSCTRRDSAML